LLAREVRVESLDGHEALEAADARQARQVHGRHATGSDLADELIAIELMLLAFGQQLDAPRHSNLPRTPPG
jgi:hypothetical protein